MDETPAPLTFLVVAESSGYCDAETGLCVTPEAEGDDSTPPPSGSPEPREENAAVS